jgi:hypothetical protein
MRPAATLVAALVLTLAEPASAFETSVRQGERVDGGRVYICHGYNCVFVAPVNLSQAEIERIAGRLRGAHDGAGERQALSAAVQAFEQVVGKRAGTAGDRGRTQVGQGRPGQLDCVDEATNTTSLLKLLASHGYLKHHTVETPAARGFFLDGRYPHNTAVIRDSETGQRWAVDSWPRANGEPPVIQPLKDWRSAHSGDPLPPAL